MITSPREELDAATGCAKWLLDDVLRGIDTGVCDVATGRNTHVKLSFNSHVVGGNIPSHNGILYVRRDQCAFLPVYYT